MGVGESVGEAKLVALFEVIKRWCCALILASSLLRGFPVYKSLFSSFLSHQILTTAW